MAKVKTKAKPAAKKPAANKKSAKPVAKTAKKPTAKKSTAKEPTAKKSTARKSTSKKSTTTPPLARGMAPAPVGPYLRSLRTCIYQVHDLALAKEFYAQALGKDPYFDEPYYVGFNVDGHELGLDPDISKRPPGGSGVIGYWRVEDINLAWQHLTTIGATSIELPHSVGLDLQTSIVADPFGNYIGLIQGA
jgi:predicted enzyme related to lactoylglutathione lyase